MSIIPLPRSLSIVIATAFGVFAPACIAQEPNFSVVQGKNADWHNEDSWNTKMVPQDAGQAVIINTGNSVIVENPVDTQIYVRVGNSNYEQPDGTLIIMADFQVESISVAGHSGSTGRVEQIAGVVTVKEINLASGYPDSIDAIYDLDGGTLTAETIKIGLMGPAALTMRGSGETVIVERTLEVGSHTALRFSGGKAGFPTLIAGIEVIIEPGATLTVEATDAETKSGKLTLIQADQPLASSFKVDMVGFAPGTARLLENEPGVVLEIK